jgi:hypothetical protein
MQGDPDSEYGDASDAKRPPVLDDPARTCSRAAARGNAHLTPAQKGDGRSRKPVIHRRVMTATEAVIPLKVWQAITADS